MLILQPRQFENGFRIERSAVHVWRAGLPSDQTEASWARDVLDDYERSHASGYSSSKDRANYVLSHGILRHLLAKYLRCAPRSIQFGYTAKGKPCLVEPNSAAALKFSVARRSGVGVFAFSLRDAVGIDVEFFAEDAIHEDAFEYALSDKERYLAALQPSWPEKVRYFLMLWTRKEAFLKARGDGLGIRPAEIDVSGPDGVIQEKGVPQPPWSVQSLALGRDHLSAVASQSGPFDVTLREFDVSKFQAATSKSTGCGTRIAPTIPADESTAPIAGL